MGDNRIGMNVFYLPAGGTSPSSGRQPTARRDLGKTPVPMSRRAFSFSQWAHDITAALVWVGFIAVAAVCLLIPGFVFGLVLFLE